MRIFNFGSINIDYVYRVPHLVAAGETLASESLETVLGGKGANQSVALARAGCKVTHIGQIGDGEAWASEQMQAAGVDVSCVRRIAGRSGHAIVQVDARGENSIVLYGGANQSFDAQVLESMLSNAQSGDWLLLQNECNQLHTAVDIAQRKKLRLAINPAPMSPSVSALPLQLCDVLIVNETEACALSGADDPQQALKRLGSRYPAVKLVLTLGADGVIMSEAGKQHSVPAYNVNVIDTTAAGDTFVGYFLASLASDTDVKDALKRACAAAALSATRSGASPSIPTLADVEHFMS